MTNETRPKFVATPRSRFAEKSATPTKIKTGISDLLKFPSVLYRMTNVMVTKKVVERIMTMVISALDSDPIDINVIAVPKPAAAPTAKKSGLGDNP